MNTKVRKCYECHSPSSSRRERFSLCCGPRGRGRTAATVDRRAPLLIVAAQQLHAQSDALVPLPGHHADVPGVERRLEEVLLVGVVVHVALEELQK